MCIRAGNAKRIYPRQSITGCRTERAQLALHFQRERIPGDSWVRLPEIAIARNESMLEHENGFDESGDAGSSLRVTDVRLDGAELATMASRAAFAKNGSKRLKLDRIARLGSRSMGFHIVDLAGKNSGVAESLSQDFLLRFGAGGDQQTAAMTIIVHGASANTA